MTMPQSDQERRPIRRALSLAAAFLALSAIANTLSPAYLPADAMQRLVGAATGALATYYGNAAAKQLPPLGAMRLDPVVEQAVRRFTAWSITLGGMAYTLAWLVAPQAHANVVAATALGSAVLLVTVRWVSAAARTPRTPRP